MQLNVFCQYTYTLETIIQAGQKEYRDRLRADRARIGYLRPSRLVKSMRTYIQRSILTILRIFMTYRPLRFFLVARRVAVCLRDVRSGCAGCGSLWMDDSTRTRCRA